MESHYYSMFVATGLDLAVIVVLKVGFGTGNVDKRPIFEKQCGPGQVIKNALLELDRMFLACPFEWNIGK